MKASQLKYNPPFNLNWALGIYWEVKIAIADWHCLACSKNRIASLAFFLGGGADKANKGDLKKRMTTNSSGSSVTSVTMTTMSVAALQSEPFTATLLLKRFTCKEVGAPTTSSTWVLVLRWCEGLKSVLRVNSLSLTAVSRSPSNETFHKILRTRSAWDPYRSTLDDTQRSAFTLTPTGPF